MSESKPRRYFLYALGEVFLVTLGILIALEVNNWNEERIEQRKIREYTQALVSDLERDIEMLKPITLQMQRTLDAIDTLGKYTRGQDLDQVNNLDLYYLMLLAGYRPYEWHRAAVEQLKGSGLLANMGNSDLILKITAYDSLTHHLDEDYAMDYEIWLEATKFASEVIDSNYPMDERAIGVLRELFRQPYTFPAKSFHDLYQDTNLQLLTDDMNKVRVLVNKFASLRNIQAHVDYEIPALLADGNELIRLLKNEYEQ